jgi:DNA polymerase-1
MKYVDLEVGPGWVVSTRSDAAQLWAWLQEHHGDVLGIDFESNAVDQFDPAYRARLCQISDGREAWIMQLERPGVLDAMRTCVHAHPYWVAHYAEADIRFGERAAPGTFRLDQVTPHAACTQPVLAYYDPRTVTSKEKIDPRISRSRGLKDTVDRLLPEGHVLVEAETAMHARMAELLKDAPPDPAAAAKVEHYAPVIGYFGLSHTPTSAKRALAHLGIVSPRKTPKGNDSWTTDALEEVRPSLIGESAEVVDALLALRAVKQRPDKEGWGWANIGDDDETYLRYAGLDPLMTVRLWHLMVKEVKARGQWPAVRQALKLQWHIDLMTLRGKLVDGPYARWLDNLYAEVISTHADELERRGINRTASGASIGKIFIALGVHSPKMTKSKEAPKECWDKDVLAGLVKDPATPPAAVELAQTIKAVRGATKFRAAYVKPMLIGLTRDNRIHCGCRAIGTITGRQSAQRPALHQIPDRSDQKIRAAFRAQEGWVYVGADISQGEPRMMAARSGDPKLARDLLAGDFYSALAALAYGNAFNSAEGKMSGTTSYPMRDGSKIGFLLRCYGGGDEKLANALGKDLQFAKDTRKRWDSEYHVLAEYERKLNWQPHVILDSGRICPLWDRYFVTDDGQVLLKHDKPSRVGLNYDTQGSLADYLNNAAERVIDAGWSWALSLMIHDEILCCVPEDKADDCVKMLEQCMTSTYRSMPIICKAKINGRTWAPQANTGFDLAEIKELADVE